MTLVPKFHPGDFVKIAMSPHVMRVLSCRATEVDITNEGERRVGCRRVRRMVEVRCKWFEGPDTLTQTFNQSNLVAAAASDVEQVRQRWLLEPE